MGCFNKKNSLRGNKTKQNIFTFFLLKYKIISIILSINSKSKSISKVRKLYIKTCVFFWFYLLDFKINKICWPHSPFDFPTLICLLGSLLSSLHRGRFQKCILTCSLQAYADRELALHCVAVKFYLVVWLWRSIQGL